MNKNELIQHARHILENCYIYDTETTGLGENDTIVEIAVISPAALAPGMGVLVSNIVKPLSPMNPAAFNVHGISEYSAINDGESISSVINYLHQQMTPTDKDKFLASFNLQFDNRLLMQSAYKTGDLALCKKAAMLTHKWRLNNRVPCIMELCNRWFSEHLVWKAETSQFVRLSLEKCLELAGIDRIGEAHSALSDAKAALALVQFIAEHEIAG